MSKSKFMFYIALFLVFGSSILFADGITSGIDKTKSYYRQGNNGSAIKEGLNTFNLISSNYSQNLLNLIPDFSNTVIVETNQFYTYSGGIDYNDFSIQVEKAFSNQSNLIRVNFDPSYNSIQRFDNLFKSFEFLMDKGNYKKFKIKIKKTEMEYITENNSAYLLYSMVTNEQDLISGLLVKITVTFWNNTKWNDKYLESYIKETAEKIKIKQIGTLIK